MEIASRPGQRYVALLKRASKAAVPALADGLAIDRGAAAEAFAAAASLVLAGLSRHQRLHPADLRAAGDLVEEYGSPAAGTGLRLRVRRGRLGPGTGHRGALGAA